MARITATASQNNAIFELVIQYYLIDLSECLEIFTQNPVGYSAATGTGLSPSKVAQKDMGSIVF